MATNDYNEVVSYNGIYFVLRNLKETRQISTKKQTVGSQLIEKNVMLPNTFDYVLEIDGWIEGSISSSGVTRRWNQLLQSEDARRHVWNDGDNNHSGSYAIRTGTLQADRDPTIDDNKGEVPVTGFRVVLVEWK